MKQNTELEKLKNMSCKDKLWYIKEYYTIHIIGAILLVGFFVMLGQIFYNRSFETVLSCIYVNAGVRAQNWPSEPLTEEFAKHLDLSKKQLISTERFDVNFENQGSELDMISTAKITALVAAKELDVIIADKATIDHYAKAELFSDLSAVLSPELFTALESRLYTHDSRPAAAVAVNISQTAFARASNFDEADCYLAIVGNSRHIEGALSLIHYIFD